MGEKVRIGLTRKIKLHDAGFSLVELIIVIAIITIVTAMALVSFNVLKSGDASKGSKLLSGQLSTLREKTLSVSGIWSMEIVNKEGRYSVTLYKDGVEQDTDNFGSRIEIAYHAEDAAQQTLASGQKIVIVYDQGSGKISKIREMDVDVSPLDAAVNEEGVNLKAETYLTFIVRGKEKTEGNEINVIYETGKIINGDMDSIQ